jgi:hypothetical protein
MPDHSRHKFPLDDWHISEIGQGRVHTHANGLHLTLPAQAADFYSNAQIADYTVPQRRFTYRPPLRLTVRAYSPSAQLKGTGGFGFWNHPFAPNERGFRIPQALWFFFGSPENNMALARGVAGHGWKAATFNAQRWQFFALLPTAPLAFLLLRWQRAYDALWPIGQGAIGVSETALGVSLLSTPHTYTLDWHPDHATFTVDGAIVLRQRRALPQSALGFVAWLDNQYAVVTPQGQFGFGFVDVPAAQSLILESVSIERL